MTTYGGRRPVRQLHKRVSTKSRLDKRRAHLGVKVAIGDERADLEKRILQRLGLELIQRLGLKRQRSRAARCTDRD